ncbi:copper resistance CopC family protein [Kitasatospora fiedleri]|uniref:copper resistance CopC family protein n=1 Tax=Kitasatospora fiedleri TaxID=2991545 RepID=UPI00249C93EB|nr:copper resistance CopC family protein [Kitasatospora fiedleri]
MSTPAPRRPFQRVLVLGTAFAVLLLAGLLWISARQPVRLAGITPADGSALTRAPGEVALTFSGDDFHPSAVYLQVNGPDGTPVTDGPPRLDGRRLVTQVRTDAAGTYRVVYRLVLDADREVSGTTAFDLGTTTAPAPAPPRGGHRTGPQPRRRRRLEPVAARRRRRPAARRPPPDAPPPPAPSPPHPRPGPLTGPDG